MTLSNPIISTRIRQLRQGKHLLDTRIEDMHLITSKILQDQSYQHIDSMLFWHRLHSKYTDGKYSGQFKGSTRAYFIALMHLAIVHESEGIPSSLSLNLGLDQQLQDIIMVGEYCITLMYLDNHLQDGKYGVTHLAAVDANRTERKKLKRELDDFIHLRFTAAASGIVQASISKLFHLYREGMKMDRDKLTYDSFMRNNKEDYSLGIEIEQFVDVNELYELLCKSYKPKYGPIDNEHYVKTYLTRSYLINGVFFQIFADLLCRLYPIKEEHKKEILAFSRSYGLLQQLVNDTCDYLPLSYGFRTSCKLVEDTFSDSRRGLMTLPMICLFNNSKHDIPRYVSDLYQTGRGASLFQEDIPQRGFLTYMKDTKALNQSMSIVALFSLYMQKQLKKSTNPAMQVAVDVCTIGQNNRYFKEYIGYHTKIFWG